MTTTEHIDFADLQIGYQFPVVEETVTQPVIDEAALAHLDFNPVHTNIRWSQRAQVFGTPKTVAHGMYTISQMTSVVLRHWLHANARIAKLDIKLTKPVPVGSVVRAYADIRELHPRGPGQDLVTVGVRAVDQDDATVGIGDITVQIAK